MWSPADNSKGIAGQNKDPVDVNIVSTAKRGHSGWRDTKLGTQGPSKGLVIEKGLEILEPPEKACQRPIILKVPSGSLPENCYPAAIPGFQRLMKGRDRSLGEPVISKALSYSPL